MTVAIITLVVVLLLLLLIGEIGVDPSSTRILRLVIIAGALLYLAARYGWL